MYTPFSSLGLNNTSYGGKGIERGMERGIGRKRDREIGRKREEGAAFVKGWAGNEWKAIMFSRRRLL